MCSTADVYAEYGTTPLNDTQISVIITNLNPNPTTQTIPRYQTLEAARHGLLTWLGQVCTPSDLPTFFSVNNSFKQQKGLAISSEPEESIIRLMNDVITLEPPYGPESVTSRNKIMEETVRQMLVEWHETEADVCDLQCT